MEERETLTHAARERGVSVAGLVRDLMLSRLRQPKYRFLSIETNTRNETVARLDGEVAERAQPPRTVSAS